MAQPDAWLDTWAALYWRADWRGFGGAFGHLARCRGRVYTAGGVSGAAVAGAAVVGEPRLWVDEFNEAHVLATGTIECRGHRGGGKSVFERQPRLHFLFRERGAQLVQFLFPVQLQ